MATFPNFDTSNSSELELGVLLDFIPISESQRQNGNRNNIPVTTNSLMSPTTLTSQASHNFYQSINNMLPTPEGSGSDNNVCPETLILSPYNMLPGSGQLTIEDHDDFFLESPESSVYNLSSYITGILSPQTSPTLPPDVSMNIASNSPTRRQSQERRFSPITKHKKASSNNKNSTSQPRRKSSFTNGNNSINSNKNNGNSNNDANGQNNAIANLNIITAPSLQDNMPNLSLGSNLVSDLTNAHSSASIEFSSSDKIAPITPSSLMKIKKKPSSPKSDQNVIDSNSQQRLKQQNQQDQSQQLSKVSTFIAPTPPNQIRTNMIATTGTAPSSGASGRKSIRSNPNSSSPLALGPSKSPHSLKPTISPNLKPKLPGVIASEIVAEQLANKSNYRSILEGTAQSLGISYPSDVHSSLESRRTTHKAAEQKRRDSLKQSFDELKKVVPFKSNNSDEDTNNNSKSNSNGKSGDGTMKNVSKLFLLKRAHDHIVELEQKSKEKDEIIQKLKDELDELKRVKRQKIEETEKEENGDDVDTETKETEHSNEC